VRPNKADLIVSVDFKTLKETYSGEYNYSEGVFRRFVKTDRSFL